LADNILEVFTSIEYVTCITFPKGSKFGQLEFKPEDIHGHNPVAHILEEFTSGG
jgi:hypothetical protein